MRAFSKIQKLAITLTIPVPFWVITNVVGPLVNRRGELKYYARSQNESAYWWAIGIYLAVCLFLFTIGRRPNVSVKK